MGGASTVAEPGPVVVLLRYGPTPSGGGVDPDRVGRRYGRISTMELTGVRLAYTPVWDGM